MTGMPTTSWVVATVLAASQILACCCAAVSAKVVEDLPVPDEHACCQPSGAAPATQSPVSHGSGSEGCPHCGSGSAKVVPTADAIFALQLLTAQWMPLLGIDAWSGDIADQLSVQGLVDGCTGLPLAQTLRAQFCLLLI